MGGRRGVGPPWRAPAWRQAKPADVRADAPSDAFVAEIRLPPIWDRRLHLRVAVRDQRGELLAAADSRPFRGLN